MSDLFLPTPTVGSCARFSSYGTFGIKNSKLEIDYGKKQFQELAHEFVTNAQ